MFRENSSLLVLVESSPAVQLMKQLLSWRWLQAGKQLVPLAMELWLAGVSWPHSVAATG